MAYALQLGAAALAAVFSAAAVGKLDDWQAWRALVEALVDEPVLRRSTAFIVPAAELATAVVLVVYPIEGLKASGVLFATFAIVPAVRYKRLRGRTCACFGATASSEIGVGLIARNVVLSLGLFVLTGFTTNVARPLPVLALVSGFLLVLGAALGVRVSSAAKEYKRAFERPLLIGHRSDS